MANIFMQSKATITKIKLQHYQSRTKSLIIISFFFIFFLSLPFLNQTFWELNIKTCSRRNIRVQMDHNCANQIVLFSLLLVIIWLMIIFKTFTYNLLWLTWPQIFLNILFLSRKFLLIILHFNPSPSGTFYVCI